jgi:hypothetical protein
VDSDEDVARLGCTIIRGYPEHKYLVAPMPGHEEEFEKWWGIKGLLVQALRPDDVSNRTNWAMSVEDTLDHMPDKGKDGRFLVSRWGSIQERQDFFEAHTRHFQDLGFYGM